MLPRLLPKRTTGSKGSLGNSGSGTFSNYQFASQPREKRRAAHTSFIRGELSWATRFPRRCCDTVTALCRFTAHVDFIPSSSFRTTSDGTPRIVEVTGATVTVDKYAMALLRVSTRAGRFLSFVLAPAANW